MENAEISTGMHDAFAFLLEELEHEDLAHSVAIESARDNGVQQPQPQPAQTQTAQAMASGGQDYAAENRSTASVNGVNAATTAASGGGGGLFGSIALLQQFAPYMQFAQYATPQMIQQFISMASAPGGTASLLASLQAMTGEDGGAGLMASLANGADGAALLAGLANGGSSDNGTAAQTASSEKAGSDSEGEGLMASLATMTGGEGLSLTPFLKQSRSPEDKITISVVAPSDPDVAAATSIALSLIPEDFGHSNGSVTNYNIDTEEEEEEKAISVGRTRGVKGGGATKEPTEQQSHSQSPQPPRKPMENSTRKRQKEELAYLRDKVLELESQLKATQDRACASAIAASQADKNAVRENQEEEEKAPSSSQQQQSGGAKNEEEDALSASVAVVPVTKMSLWERVAKRQLIEKQKAEMKNLKLKEALEDQLKIAKNLEKVLKKRPSATISTQVLDSVQVVNSKRFCSLSRSEANIYDMLIANTEKVYAELDDVCARNEHMQVHEDINDTKLMVDSSNQLYMEITHAKIIPFDMATTIDGIWRCLSLAYVPIADGSYEAVERTHDTICAKSTMAFNVKNTQAIVHTRFVMKKFVEKDRVVLACESSTQSEGPQDIVHGLKCLEKGWVVIKPVRSKDDGKPSSTIIQLCMRMTPTISGEMLETQRRQAGAVTDVILGSFNKSLVLLYQAMENIIMETVAPPDAKKQKTS